jgi:polyphenol oxidase
LIYTKYNGVSYLQFPNLTAFPELGHGVFTRNGGFSKEPYKSLNVSNGVGDDSEVVEQNRAAVSMCMGGNELIFVKQVHDNGVVVVSERNTDSSGFPAGDAMITDIDNKMLAIKIADCQSVLIYDPARRVAANVHSGWRGSIKNIIGRTVSAMKDRFNCRPSDMVAGISPSLGPCCAEFINYRKEIPEEFWEYRVNSDHFDFWRMSVDQLCNEGVGETNICSSKICTKCNPDLFFSYRGERNTGRFASVIGVK